MKQIGYSLVDSQNAEVATSRSLPWSPPPPGNPRGRLATFTAVGQTVDGYTVVERWETERENEYQYSAGQTISWDGTKMVVDKQWTYPSLASMKAERIEGIKLEARNRILAVLPEWKQANITARQGELHRIEVGLMRDDQGGLVPQRSLTQEEIAELAAIANAWAFVKATRVHSDALEAQVAALTTVEEVVGWTAAGWPG